MVPYAVLVTLRIKWSKNEPKQNPQWEKDANSRNFVYARCAKGRGVHQMGLYDSLYVQCPGCNTSLLEYQSKAGKNRCDNFTLENVPPVIAYDLNNAVEYCPQCDQNVKLTVKEVHRPDIRAELTEED